MQSFNNKHSGSAVHSNIWHISNIYLMIDILMVVKDALYLVHPITILCIYLFIFIPFQQLGSA